MERKMPSLVELWASYDEFMFDYLDSGSFTKHLVSNFTSKVITEILLLGFIVVFNYELIYWGGIYLGLWEYHAKDIFKEVPVHCARVFVRMNVAHLDDLKDVRQLYVLRRESKYNVFKWREVSREIRDVMRLKDYVTFYFEFGPDDFEMNDEPDYGSTLIHLKGRILEVFNESDLFSHYQSNQIDEKSIIVFNNRLEELTDKDNDNYLSKLHIETGNIIDSVIVY